MNAAPICQFGESCYRLQESHFSSYRHPHLDDILNQCDDDIEIPGKYSRKISEETLMSQLNIVKWLRVSSNLSSSVSPSVSAAHQKPFPTVASEAASSSKKVDMAMKRGLDNYMSYVRKRCKGDILQKIEYSEPYRFFLSGIAAESKTHDEMLTVSFPELLNEKLGVIESSLQINFMVQISWLLAQYAVNNERTTPITLLYGCEDPELKYSVENNLLPKVTPVYIKPSAFGSHHTKMMILSYTDGSIRVIVTTGNLIEMDWENTTQGIWISPRLPRVDDISGIGFCDSETNFKRDLLNYLEAYKLPAVKPWIEKVENADCREIKVFFVASTPGTHSKSVPYNWGLTRMTQLLSEHALVPNENAKDWPLYYQCSSIGSLGKDSYAWLLGEFTRTMQSANKCCSFQPEVKVIYPCFADVASSYDGLAAGGCLPYGKATHDKQTWLMNYLCKWRSDERYRTRAMPHIKTYCRVSPCKKYLSWCLLTSANLSKAAWGMENKAKTDLRILNYEVGVLFIPQNLISKSRLPLTKESPSEDGPLFSLPYDIPLTTYTKEDTPWFIDMLQ